MWQLADQVVWREKGAMCVLLNTVNGHYYTVNETGTILWKALVGEGLSLPQAVARIVAECEGAPEPSAVEEECRKLVSEWEAEKLIVGKN